MIYFFNNLILLDIMETFLGTMILGLSSFWVSIVLLSLCSVAFSVWMLIDCIKREESDFKDKTLWTILLAVGLILGYNLILSVIYYFVVKRELDK